MLWLLLLFPLHAAAINNQQLGCDMRAPDLGQLAVPLNVVERAQHIGCKELIPGRSRIIDVDAFRSPTMVQHKYKITRHIGDNYEVALNLKFLDALKDPKGLNGSFNPDLNNKMKRKIQGCLNIANKAMTAPGGKRLTIRLTGDRENNPRPPEVPILVGPADLRATSQRYNSTIDCPTVMHEVMHLLGLCDEYQESTMGYVVDKQTGAITWSDKDAQIHAFDCRAVGQPHSLMRNNWDAYMNVFGALSSPNLIHCECLSQSCKVQLRTGLLRAGPDHACPTGSRLRFTPADATSDPLLEHNLRYTRNGVYSDGGDKFTVAGGLDPIPGRSLLMPAHFEAIVNPGCRTNFEYYQCAVDAYSTSTQNRGQGCQLAPRPSACVNGNGSHWVAPTPVKQPETPANGDSENTKTTGNVDGIGGTETRSKEQTR